MRLHAFLAATALLTASLAAQADPITYNLSGLTFSNGATATGTVTTDGMLGVLSQADVTAYDFVLSGQGKTETITLANGLSVDSSDLTATVGGLFFNFSTEYGFLIFDAAPTFDGLCFAGVNEDCDNGTIYVSGPSVSIGISDTEVGEAITSGNEQFASNLAATPEPSSIALLGTGLLGLAGVVRKRFA